ncbi:galactosylceramide sulfotransferase-like [Lytechinus variegatus]|uniref:galactosylceramide sulfotransferase-like n=1 Tax=Lytechinus variegatus TaxID=7654 RepID=UPI001BB1D9EB|nr:galactosylceramide sulfotransferase-like [Lytechinus variegatus]
MKSVRRFAGLVTLGIIASVVVLLVLKGPTTFKPVAEDNGGKIKTPSAHTLRIAPGSLRHLANATASQGHSSEDENRTSTVKITHSNSPSSTNTSNQHGIVDRFGKDQQIIGKDPHGGMTILDTPNPSLGRHGDNSSGPERRNETRCIPRKNMMYLKTHKTGSSTLQNIIYRYGDAHGLKFALPKAGVYLGTPSLFRRTFPIPSPTGKYNMLANHARYNRQEMADIMYKDAAYVTIIRHPSTQFESMYAYYGFKGTFKVDLEGFADKPQNYYRRQSTIPSHSALNPTLYDLGMSKLQMNNDGAIRNKIATLENDFDLVLVAEHLLESLVLLKELMCWDLSDVTFFSANARTKSHVDKMSKRTFDQLYKWNHGDALLYEHFNQTLWTKIKAYGQERMDRDVRLLDKMNKALTEKCLDGTKTETMAYALIRRYVLRQSMKDNIECVRMIRPAIQYLESLKKKQRISAG